MHQLKRIVNDAPVNVNTSMYRHELHCDCQNPRPLHLFPSQIVHV